MKKLLLLLLLVPLLFSCNLDAEMGIFQDILSSQKVDSTENTAYIGTDANGISYVLTQKGIQAFNGTDLKSIYVSTDARIYGAVLIKNNKILFYTYKTSTIDNAQRIYKYYTIDLEGKNETPYTLIPEGYEPSNINDNSILLYNPTTKTIQLGLTTGTEQDLSDISATGKPEPVQGGFSYSNGTEYVTYILSGGTSFTKVSVKPGEETKFGKLLGYYETESSKGNFAISTSDGKTNLWKIDAGVASKIDELSSSYSFKPIYLFESVNADNKAVLAFYFPLNTSTAMTTLLLETLNKDIIKEVPMNILSSTTEILAYEEIDTNKIRIITVDTGFYEIEAVK